MSRGGRTYQVTLSSGSNEGKLIKKVLSTGMIQNYVKNFPPEILKLCRMKRNEFFESMKAKLKCRFESCSKVVPYESFRAHADSCPENPENKVKCAMCSQEFHQNQIASHM